MIYSIIIANKFVNFKLIKTLKSIFIQKHLNETEVIIVNKDPNNKLNHLTNIFPNINFKIINGIDKNISDAFNKGLKLARELLLFLNENEIPCGYEILDTFTPQYICDLISWGAIGARTTESQVHRQLVSGLSMPVGFKNNSSGDMDIAANAMISADYQHCFYGINGNGKAAIVRTKGNEDTHVILRGSKYGTNYDSGSINDMKNTLKNKNLRENVMVDCSHGNSNKNYKNQMNVIDYIAILLSKNNDAVMGFMVESNLVEGKQKLVFGEADKLEWGKSITDSCVNMEETEEMIKKIYSTLNF
jgi:3-deoxy-7-phosphoheptulonate synthase